jgi:rubredoxin
MVCPRCKVWQDVLRFVPLEQIGEYAHETVPIYKCALCRWLFAPSLPAHLDDGDVLR